MFEDLPGGGAYTVMVIDDLMEEVSKSKTAMDVFMKHSHHRNMTVLLSEHTTQDSSHRTHAL